jgi:hypothetical protein
MLKEIVIGAIDQHHGHRRFFKIPGTSQSSKAAANDYHDWILLWQLIPRLAIVTI